MNSGRFEMEPSIGTQASVSEDALDLPADDDNPNLDKNLSLNSFMSGITAADLKKQSLLSAEYVPPQPGDIISENLHRQLSKLYLGAFWWKGYIWALFDERVNVLLFFW